jgi:hypothetical protein
MSSLAMSSLALSNHSRGSYKRMSLCLCLCLCLAVWLSVCLAVCLSIEKERDGSYSNDMESKPWTVHAII